MKEITAELLEQWFKKHRLLLVLIPSTLFALLTTVQMYVATDMRPFPWAEALLWQLVGWYMWAAISLVLLRIVYAYPPGRHGGRSILLYILGGFFFATLQLFLNTVLVWPLVAPDESLVVWARNSDLICGYPVMWRVFIYCGIFAACCALYFYFTYHKETVHSLHLQSRLLTAKLDRFRAQLNPSFLFDILKSISSLMQKNLRTAETLISRLGDFLRLTLDVAGASAVSLEHEIRTSKSYLSIESIRRAGRINTSWQLSGDVQSARVPRMILFSVIRKVIEKTPADADLEFHLLAERNATGECRLRLDVTVDAENAIESLIENIAADFGETYGNEHRLETVSQGQTGRFVVHIAETTEEDRLTGNDYDAALYPAISPNGSAHQSALANPGLWRRKSVRVAMVFLAWSALAMTQVGREVHVVGMWAPDVTVPKLLFMLSIWYLWAAATPLVLWTARRFPVLDGRWRKYILAHLLMFAALWAAVIVLSNALYSWMDSDQNLTQLLRAGFRHSPFAMNFILYSVIVACYSGFAFYQKAVRATVDSAELKSQLVQAQFEALKMKLHPHFLFNALNSLSELMHQNLPAAQTMLERLEHFLVFSLKHSNAQVLTLREELEFMKCYLDIQYVRFADRLTVNLKIDPDALDVYMPNLFWQPVVENAIRHGVARRDTRGEVQIRAFLDSGVLHFEVQDNGPGLKSNNWKEGFGLNSTRALLDRVYGSAHILQLANAAGGGMLARIEIPAVLKTN